MCIKFKKEGIISIHEKSTELLYRLVFVLIHLYINNRLMFMNQLHSQVSSSNNFLKTSVNFNFTQLKVIIIIITVNNNLLFNIIYYNLTEIII